MTSRVVIAAAAAVAAASAGTKTGIAMPAAAQTWGPDYGRQTPYGQNGYSQYGYGQNGFARGPSNYASQRIAQRIENGVRNGSLTASEARSLHNRLEAVVRLEIRYGRDGYISPNEGRELDRRYADHVHHGRGAHAK